MKMYFENLKKFLKKVPKTDFKLVLFSDYLGKSRKYSKLGKDIVGCVQHLRNMVYCYGK